MAASGADARRSAECLIWSGKQVDNACLVLADAGNAKSIPPLIYALKLLGAGGCNESQEASKAVIASNGAIEHCEAALVAVSKKGNEFRCAQEWEAWWVGRGNGPIPNPPAGGASANAR